MTDIPRCLLFLSDALKPRLATCAWPRGSTRVGMKPNGAFEVGRALCTRKSNNTLGLYDLLKLGWPGLRSISIGREDPSALALSGSCKSGGF